MKSKIYCFKLPAVIGNILRLILGKAVIGRK